MPPLSHHGPVEVASGGSMRISAVAYIVRLFFPALCFAGRRCSGLRLSQGFGIRARDCFHLLLILFCVCPCASSLRSQDRQRGFALPNWVYTTSTGDPASARSPRSALLVDARRVETRCSLTQSVERIHNKASIDHENLVAIVQLCKSNIQCDFRPEMVLDASPPKT